MGHNFQNSAVTMVFPSKFSRLSARLLLFSNFKWNEKKYVQQFHAATTPRTFAANFEPHSGEERRIAEFHQENGVGEALHGIWTKIGAQEDVFQITRHPANWNTKEAREWIYEMTKERRYPRIWIENPTIG